MISEERLIDLIVALESKWDPDDDSCYLDEGEQAELNSLYVVLDDDLPSEATARIEEARKNYGNVWKL